MPVSIKSTETLLLLALQFRFVELGHLHFAIGYCHPNSVDFFLALRFQSSYGKFKRASKCSLLIKFLA